MYAEDVFGLGVIAFVIACFAAWVTHVVWVITVLTSAAGATFGQIAIGAIGGFFFPVGVIHGFMIWFS